VILKFLVADFFFDNVKGWSEKVLDSIQDSYYWKALRKAIPYHLISQ